MGAHEKEVARRFIPAFLLGDVDGAAALLSDDVDLVDGDSVFHGIDQLGSVIDPLEEGDRRELSAWKMKEVHGVVFFRGVCASWARDDPDGSPSAYSEVSLGLTVRGEKITRLELLRY